MPADDRQARSAAYPLTWTHTQRGGYGFPIRTPCRIVREGRARVRIAIPLTNGGEREKWVPREKVTA